MKLLETTYQSRRDFKADFVCEHCGLIENKWGYDDENFHENVIPKMKCINCEKTSEEKLGELK